MNISQVCNKKLCKSVFFAIVMVFGGGLFVLPSYEQALTQTVTFTVPFEITATPLCGGNEVSFSGITRFLFHETLDENGQVHQHSHLNFFKATGTDLFGERYKIVEADNLTTHDNNQAGVFHSVVKGELISEGKPSDTQTHTAVTINLLTIFDENGEVKTVVEKIDVRCNGELISNGM